MDFSFLNPIVEFFQFISTIIGTIINGIYGIVNIITGVINIIIKVIGVLPDNLSMITYIFVSLFSVILTYKIFRKG